MNRAMLTMIAVAGMSFAGLLASAAVGPTEAPTATDADTPQSAVTTPAGEADCYCDPKTNPACDG